MARKTNEVKSEGTTEEKTAKVSRLNKVKSELAQIAGLGGPFVEAADKAGKRFEAAATEMKAATKAVRKLRKSAESLFSAE